MNVPCLIAGLLLNVLALLVLWGSPFGLLLNLAGFSLAAAASRRRQEP